MTLTRALGILYPILGSLLTSGTWEQVTGLGADRLSDGLRLTVTRDRRSRTLTIPGSAGEEGPRAFLWVARWSGDNLNDGVAALPRTGPLVTALPGDSIPLPPSWVRYLASGLDCADAYVVRAAYYAASLFAAGLSPILARGRAWAGLSGSAAGEQTDDFLRWCDEGTLPLLRVLDRKRKPVHRVLGAFLPSQPPADADALVRLCALAVPVFTARGLVEARSRLPVADRAPAERAWGAFRGFVADRHALILPRLDPVPLEVLVATPPVSGPKRPARVKPTPPPPLPPARKKKQKPTPPTPPTPAPTTTDPFTDA